MPETSASLGVRLWAVAGVGLAAAVTQPCEQLVSPTLYLVLSPVPALCLFFLLQLFHPFVGAIHERMKEWGGRQPAFDLLVTDPVLAAAKHMPPPPHPWRAASFALGLAALADLCDGIRLQSLAGSGSLAAACELAQEAIGAASAACFLVAISSSSGARGGGGWFSALRAWLSSLASAVTPMGHPGQALLFAVLAIAVGQKNLLAPPATLDVSWTTHVLPLATFARTLVASALTARGVARVLEWATAPRDWRVWDPPRLLTNAAGGALLLAPSVLRALLPPSGAPTLALGAARVGSAACALGALYGLFPREGSGGGGVDEDEDDLEPLPPGSRFGSLDEMRRARRAAREARERAARAPAPPPLLLESWNMVGGVQGLRCHNERLCCDPDGDEAHDFWEAVSGGCFRRIT